MTIEDVIMEEDGCVVGREIVSASFEEWVTHVFDHPPDAEGWWWNDDALAWAVPTPETVGFIARTFEESSTLLKRFTDSQVESGLNYICSPSCSDIAFTLKDELVSWAERGRAIRSIRKLYSDCFMPRCAPFISHLSKTDGPPLNGVCYMWWDVFPINDQPQDPTSKKMDAECLAVMEFALGLNSVACQESALHGLGHWVFGYPEHVKKVIDRFIEANSGASHELIKYARAAREGNVL